MVVSGLGGIAVRFPGDFDGIGDLVPEDIVGALIAVPSIVEAASGMEAASFVTTEGVGRFRPRLGRPGVVANGRVTGRRPAGT